MSVQFIALMGLAIGIVVYLVYQRHNRQQKMKSEIFQHLDSIRQHQVFIKPDQTRNTFSGRFAGRLLRFVLGPDITIQAEVGIDREADQLWIYPIRHSFTDDKLIDKLEKNRAWTGNTEFDHHYILAGRPRHLANAVIYPAKRLQSQLLKYPNSVVIADQNGVTLQPNIDQTSHLTSENWRDLMGIASDIAQYLEEQYEASMFSGITVDESAYPNHKGGHVN